MGSVEDIVPVEAASPCINVCKLDVISGLCEGCFRTRDEIAGWRKMTISQRIAVNRRATARR